MIVSAELLKKEKEPKIYTLKEYLKKEGKAVDKHEYFDGEIVKLPPSKFYQNLLSTNVNFLIKNAVSSLSEKFFVVGKSQKIYVESENSSVYPDGLVVSEAPIFYGNQEFLLTNPLLIVEVLSRSTQSYDRNGKFELYANLPSLHEYVLVDPRKYFVETRFREEPDLWRIKTEKDVNQSVLLRSLPVTIALSDIYEHVVFPERKSTRRR